MAKKQQRPERSSVVKPVADRNNRDDALQERYGRRPSLRELYEDGQIDLTAYQEAKRLRDEGPRTGRSSH